VTSISVPGGSWFTDVGVRDAVDLGLVEGPRIACASRMIATYGSIEDEDPSWVGTPDHSLGVLCNSATEMVTEVRRQLKHGVDFIKLADSRSGDVHCISEDEMSAVAGEAHRRGARVAIHSRGPGSTRAAARAGIDWIIHADLATERDIDAVAEAGCRLMPTATFVQKVLDVGQSVGQDTIQINIDLDRMKRQIDGIARVLQQARALGIPVMCGTDSGNYGWMPYGELHANEADIMVRLGGYTAMEAIVAFTHNGAYALGLEDELGVLAPGRLADVIIVSRDPVADIRVLRGGAHLTTVIKDGKVVDLKREEPDMLSFADEAARRSNVA
jgi:imidazolonepropionase-like amidohydrolase